MAEYEFFGTRNASKELKDRLNLMYDRLKSKKLEPFEQLEGMSMVDFLALSAICTRVHYPKRESRTKYSSGGHPNALQHLDFFVGEGASILEEIDENLTIYNKNLTSKKGSKEAALDSVARSAGLVFKMVCISTHSLMGVLSWGTQTGDKPQQGGENLVAMVKTLLDKSRLKARPNSNKE